MLMWILLCVSVVVLATLAWHADRLWARWLRNRSAAHRELDEIIAREQAELRLHDEQAAITARVQEARRADAERRREESERIRRELEESERKRRAFMQGRPGLAASPTGNRKQRLAHKAAKHR